MLFVNSGIPDVFCILSKGELFCAFLQSVPLAGRTRHLYRYNTTAASKKSNGARL